MIPFCVISSLPQHSSCSPPSPPLLQAWASTRLTVGGGSAAAQDAAARARRRLPPQEPPRPLPPPFLTAISQCATWCTSTLLRPWRGCIRRQAGELVFKIKASLLQAFCEHFYELLAPVLQWRAAHSELRCLTSQSSRRHACPRAAGGATASRRRAWCTHPMRSSRRVPGLLYVPAWVPACLAALAD